MHQGQVQKRPGSGRELGGEDVTQAKRDRSEREQRRRNNIPPTLATKGPSGVTRAALLAMSARTQETRPATTVTRGVRSPWLRRQCPFQAAATQKRQSRSQRASPSGAGRQGLQSEQRHRHGEAVTRQWLPEGAQPAAHLAGEGACKKHVREGIAVGHPTRGEGETGMLTCGQGETGMLTYLLKALPC
jgi:hypothetical protein